ncbi:hypothetical protein Ga0061079_105153 [Apibacter mensalis]|uniref:Uncharacterized protein n=2 Tax=Apibacter mensalis TaxID=1586267 RepID=A0A0X3APA6_9FLAO|nr:hypothetical protein Ga0061079_105153 [Apibacter mensalis]
MVFNLVNRYKIIIVIIIFITLIIEFIIASCKKTYLAVDNNKMRIQVIDSAKNPLPNVDIVIYEIEKSIFGKLWWKLHKIQELRTNEKGMMEFLINKEKRYSIELYYKDKKLIEFGEFEAKKINFNKVYEIRYGKDSTVIKNINSWLKH